MTAAFQDVFALLLVHPPTRKAFLADVEGFAAQHDAPTAALLRALNVEDVKASAENLLLKRGGHLKEMLAELCAALGERWWPAVRAHAGRCLVEGHDKHRADALRFVLDLRTDQDARVAAMARRRAAFLGCGVTLQVRTLPGSPLPQWSLRPSLFTLRYVDGMWLLGSKGRVVWWAGGARPEVAEAAPNARAVPP